MREPVPVFLMSIAMMIYPSVISGLVLQSLLFLATLLVIYATLKDYDRRVAFFAASLWVVSKPVFVQIGEDNGELAAALFLSLSLYFFLKGLAAPRRVLMWGLAGLFAGLGSLSRTVILGSSLGMAIVLFCVLFVKARRSPRLPHIHPAKPVFYFLLMFFIVYSPWVIRNRIVFGKTVIGSTLTGYNIYRMNYIVAQNDFSPHYVGPQDGHAAVAALLEARSLTGLENEAQMQGIYMEAGVEIIKAHPIQYIQLSLYRFLPLWFNASVNEAYGSDLSALDYVGLAEQAFLLVMVVLGAAGNWKKFWPFILVLFLGSAAYMAIDAQLRYLVDFMPVVVSLGALSLASLGLLNEPNNVLFDRSP